MTLDHAVKGFAVDAEQPRGCLFVAAGVLEHPGHIASFNIREGRPKLFLGSYFSLTVRCDARLAVVSDGRSCARMVPSHIAAARTTAFSSSLMFPGHA